MQRRGLGQLISPGSERNYVANRNTPTSAAAEQIFVMNATPSTGQGAFPPMGQGAETLR